MIGKVQHKPILDALMESDKDPSGYLKGFVTPKFSDSFEMSWKSLDKELRIMYLVTSSICDFIPHSLHWEPVSSTMRLCS
jgi:hypothetical protein